MKLRLSPSGQLQLDGTDVSVKACFPLSAPDASYSLLDKEGKELGLVGDPSALDPESRAALKTALGDAAFTIGVTGIDSIVTDIELRVWKVRTEAGPRTFETRLGSWPRKLDTGGVLIQDVAEDLYLIPDAGALDEASQKLLWAYSD
jgi:hypothetical protein